MIFNEEFNQEFKDENAQQELWNTFFSILNSSRKLPQIEPISRNSPIPLSYAQQRFWFLEQLSTSHTAVNNISVAFQISGSLDVEAIAYGLTEIQKRHEILRTSFHPIDGQIYQFISQNLNIPLLFIDFTQLPKTEQEEKIADLLKSEVQQIFKLTEEPLYRLKIFQISQQEYILVLTMHHVISDGWSFDVFFNELSLLHQMYLDKSVGPLSALPIQYPDFTNWQQQLLHSTAYKLQLAYWKKKLGGDIPMLNLPTDRPRPPIQHYQGKQYLFQLPQKLSELLKLLSQQSGVTLYMTLLSVFKILLYRYTNQSDILIGSPISGRNRPEIKGLIGPFFNILAMRTTLDGNQRFKEVLNRVKQVTLEAYAHQDLPYEVLLQELQPERSLSKSPLFQVMFALQKSPTNALSFPNATITRLEIHNGGARFDLVLEMEETLHGISGCFEYDLDLFDTSTIVRMAGHFQTLLEGIVTNPEQRISDLPLLTATEQHQLLVEWNNTQADYPHDVCIHQLFESQVERTPNAIAILFENEQLTYQQLNHRANQLSHYLQKLGVKPEVLVGICLERSPETIVGFLAILKAGGAYVPLDPTYPQERLAFMLDDAQVGVLITQTYLIERLPPHKAHVICLDRDWEAISPEDKLNPSNSTNANNLAYAIYTSGSTGQPKGVAVTHRSVNRLVCNTNYIEIQSRDRIAQVSNTAFDAATFEIWGALLHGATLVQIPQNLILAPQNFAAQLREQKISILFLTTALFNQLARTVPEAFAELRYLLFGGEAVDTKWVKEVLNRHPPQHLLHVYGPTENTTFTSWYLVQEVPEKATTLPIGKPIHNTEIYLLDRNLQPVPIGISGELYIAGDGLARGYLNRPELTHQKFLPNPFNHNYKKSNYLYRTGDLARYLIDGNIEFLGRCDRQVKIRGFRIEIGEIESALAQHPEVEQAVAIACEDYTGNKRLVAYVVLSHKPNHKPTPTIKALHSFLKQKLPQYMLPSTFVILDALPLTPNGKIDHHALPAIDQAQTDLERLLVTPRNLTQEMLAQIWAEVLGIESFQKGSSCINIYDNFFELGGHSLAAAFLIARVQQVFQVDLPLWQLFDTPTIAGLAESIETESQTNMVKEQTKKQNRAYLVPIQVGGSKTPFFIVPGGHGGGTIVYEGQPIEDFELIAYAKLVYFLGREQPVYGLQARGWSEEQKPYNRVEDMASDYIKEIRALQPDGPYLLGGECIGGVVAFEMARQLHAQGQKVGLLVLMDTRLLSNIQLLNYFLQKLISIARIIHLDRFTKLSFDLVEFLHYMIEKVRKARDRFTKILLLDLGELLPYISAKVRQVQDLMVEHNYYRAVLMRYRPQAYRGRITLLVNEKDYEEDPSMGWKHLANGGLEIHKIQGDHDSYIGEHYKTTAEVLKGCLDAQSGNI